MRGDLRMRTVTTASGKQAVQVVRYAGKKREILTHLGSAATDDEHTALEAAAARYIEEHRAQQALFKTARRLVDLDRVQLVNVTHCFARSVLARCAEACGLAFLHPLYLDLAFMRIIEPSSKLRAIELIDRHWGLRYAERTVYRLLKKLIEQKRDIERAASALAAGSCAVLLYDVTTLYFETHEPDDDLRARGFSKDHKSQQPQITVGLLVSQDGTPLRHDVWKGNTFEGKTMLPTLEAYGAELGEKPIIVADAAMLSRENSKKLEDAGWSYIVGARLGNLPPALVERIGREVPREDGALRRVLTDRGALIVAFSKARHKKDVGDVERQWKRAEALVAKAEPGRRAKFVCKEGGRYALDEALKRKAEALAGLKGYHTNIPETKLASTQVIERYRDLWRVESSFRMAKSDLATRPIFHHAEDAVRSHVLLCFVGLVLLSHLERQTGLSARQLRDILWDVSEAHLFDALTGETHVLRSSLDEYRASRIYTLLGEPETH
jgi:hypothetical protein